MTEILAPALAAFWVWYVIAFLDPPIVGRVTRWLADEAELWEPPTWHHAVRKFLNCPWCFGAWLSIGFVFAYSGDVSTTTAVHALAAAAIVGTAGTLIPDDGSLI